MVTCRSQDAAICSQSAIRQQAVPKLAARHPQFSPSSTSAAKVGLRRTRVVQSRYSAAVGRGSGLSSAGEPEGGFAAVDEARDTPCSSTDKVCTQDMRDKPST
jgi:hypothetical protein